MPAGHFHDGRWSDHEAFSAVPGAARTKTGVGSRDFWPAVVMQSRNPAEMASSLPYNSASLAQPKPTRKKRLGMSNR